MILSKAARPIYTFDKKDLIPPAWEEKFTSGRLTFNPTLTRIETGYAMCYRVAAPNDTFRLLATCHLDMEFRIVPGTVTPLSDHIEFARTDGLNERAIHWHADARYQKLGEKLYLTWNDGGNRPFNHQFIVEMTLDGLCPIGPARELVLYGMERRSTEKNWMLIRGRDQKNYVVYSCSPHTILEADFSDPHEVPCHLTAEVEWSNNYSTLFGVIRGGAQPVLTAFDADSTTTRFLNISHSSYKLISGRKYEMTAYEFEAEPPFFVTRCATLPIPLDTGDFGDFEFDKLNEEVVSVVYPCGAVIDDSDIVISYGINDENLAITRLPLKDIDEAMKPIMAKAQSRRISVRQPEPFDPAVFGDENDGGVPLFWWDATGKRFDGERGNRRFKIGNFGDIASKDVFERISGMKSTKPLIEHPKLISIGSVLHTASEGDVIWGSGIKGTSRKMREGVHSLDIRAVRGPLTLDFLRESGYDVSKVMEVFDPGCLVNFLWRDEIANYDVAANEDLGPFRIVPHYRDDLLFRRMHHTLHHAFLSVDCTPQQMIERMLGAEAVYSSSLHGVIFAESLGIPAYWLKSIGGEDGYKFYDYYYGTGRYAVKCFETLEEAMANDPMPLPKFRSEAYLETFPHDALAGLRNGVFGFRTGDRVKLGRGMDPTAARLVRAAPGQTRNGMEGLWFVGRTSTIGLRLAIAEGEKVLLQLNLRPFNHRSLPKPRMVKVIFGGRICHEISWEVGNTDLKTVSVPISRDMMNGSFLRVEVETDQAIAPSDIKVGQVDEPITCRLQDFSLSAL